MSAAFQPPPLSDLPSRVVGLFASWVAGSPCSVQYSSRLEVPVAVTLDRSVILVDDTVARLRDVATAALLVGRRDDKPIRDELKAGTRLSDATVRGLLDDVVQQFGTAFPRARHWQSWIDAAQDRLPHVSHHTLPLEPTDRPWLTNETSGTLLTGARSEAAGDDLHALVDDVRRGRVSPGRHPLLPDLPYVRIRLDLAAPARLPDAWERMERLMDFARSGASDMARCIYRKTMDSVPWESARRRRLTGTRLDGSRLHDAYVAARTGRPLAAFRGARPQAASRWNPDHHLGGMIFDLPWVRRGLDPAAFDAARQNRGLGIVAQLLGLFEHLDVLGPVLGTCHGLVKTDAGSDVYVAVEYLIRPAGRKTGASLWTTLGTALEIPTPEGLEACTVPGVQFQALADELRPHVDRKHKTIQAYQVSGAPLHARFGDRESMRRVARDVDAGVDKLDAFATASITYLGVFPQDLVDAAEPGGQVKTSVGV